LERGRKMVVEEVKVGRRKWDVVKVEHDT
jgi:hypothetical protein